MAGVGVACYRLLQAATGCCRLLQAVEGCYKLLLAATVRGKYISWIPLALIDLPHVRLEPELSTYTRV